MAVKKTILSCPIPTLKDKLFVWLEALGINIYGIWEKDTINLPMTIEYNREQLGEDRLANIVAAFLLYLER